MSTTTPWADARARIEAAIVPGQPAPLAGLPVEWPNETFTKPEPPAPWLSVEISGTGMGAIEMSGAGAWTETGDVIVHISVPAGTGDSTARAIATTISRLFRGTSAQAGALLYERQIIGVGGPPEDDGAWWILPVLIAWKYTDRPQ